jgi:hypothetical protein
MRGKTCRRWIYNTIQGKSIEYMKTGGPGVASWLRHWATSRRVSESIPSGVARGFCRSYRRELRALRSTQPLKMSTRTTPGGKGGRCVRVTTLPPS